MRKIVSVLLCLIMVFGILTFPVSANDVAPCANNTCYTDTTFVIDDNGDGDVYVSYMGYEGITTGATITIRFEKRFLGLFWKDVSLPYSDNTKTIEATGYDFDYTYLVHFTSTGTYRAIVRYEIRGSGGTADVYETKIEVEY